MIDHVTLRVADLDASKRFYDTVLGVLGLKHDDPDYPEWGDFSIAADGQPLSRSSLHIAFFAPSHELVDAFHRAGVEAGYDGRRRPRPAPAVPRGLLRRLPARPRRQQRRGRLHRQAARQPGDIDHLWLRTRDVAAIKAFYVAAGHEIGVDEPDHVQIVTDGASISYVTGEPVTEHVHIAFGVATNEQVDAFHAAATEAGYTDNGAPGERAVYHPGYYGAFVLDPDGHNIEAVNHNRTTAS